MGSRNDTPTMELGFIERVTRDRRLTILHQKYRRPDGTTYWREVSKLPSSVLIEEPRQAAAASTES